MKKYIYSTIILLLFLCFAIYVNKDSYYVIKIITPDKIQVDLNNNRVVDDNETICINNIKSFNTNLEDNFDTYTIRDNAIVGYLAHEYANSLLMNKKIKVKFSNKANQDCRYATVLIDKFNYGDLLFDNGFASKNGEFNNKKVADNINAGEKLNLKILNTRSNIVHNFECEYGIKSSNYVIIPNLQSPNNSRKCKVCNVKNTNNRNKNSTIHKTYLNDGSIKILLTDFTTQLYPTNDCKSEVCKSLIELINNSNKSIDIAAYGWSNIDVLNESLKLAKKRGVNIRLVYDSIPISSKEHYNDKNTIINLSDINSSDNHDARLMHNKFFIFDKKIVYTGSMNFSKTGLSGFNSNSVAIIESRDIANLYTKEFEQMLAGKFHDKKSKLKIKNNFKLDESAVSIFFSPYDNTSIFIIKKINNANKYIYIPAFVITHNGITDAIINAYKRGVDVKIILDATSINSRNLKFNILKANKIPIKIENFAGKLHSKTIIIDDKFTIMGSMNFSQSGDSKNDENVLIIENSNISSNYKNFFLNLWDSIPDKWLYIYPGAESHNSIGSCSDGIDNDHDGKIDLNDEGCKTTY